MAGGARPAAHEGLSHPQNQQDFNEEGLLILSLAKGYFYPARMLFPVGYSGVVYHKQTLDSAHDITCRSESASVSFPEENLVNH